MTHARCLCADYASPPCGGRRTVSHAECGVGLRCAHFAVDPHPQYVQCTHLFHSAVARRGDFRPGWYVRPNPATEVDDLGRLVHHNHERNFTEASVRKSLKPPAVDDSTLADTCRKQVEAGIDVAQMASDLQSQGTLITAAELRSKMGRAKDVYESTLEGVFDPVFDLVPDKNEVELMKDAMRLRGNWVISVFTVHKEEHAAVAARTSVAHGLRHATRAQRVCPRHGTCPARFTAGKGDQQQAPIACNCQRRQLATGPCCQQSALLRDRCQQPPHQVDDH